MKNYNVLTLAEALQQWCDPLLLLQVMEWEPKCTASEVDSLRRIQLTNRGFRRDATLTNVTTNPYMRLRSAWNDLEQDFCRRIEQGQIYLRGVRVAPERYTEPEIIHGVWAAAFNFDFSRGVIKLGKLCFAAIACSLDPWTVEPISTTAQLPKIHPTADPLSGLRPEDFPTKTDELFLAMLEEHAKRVIKRDGPLRMAGKDTLLPIIRRKMHSRVEAGEMLGSITAEAAWLAKWIDERVKHYRIPAAPTIKKALGDDFNQLAKPRSTPAIQ